MQRVAIVSGTLGLGTALVFAAAVLASALFPNGGTVQVGWNGGGWEKGIAIPEPMPAPAIQPGVIVDEGKGGAIGDDGRIMIDVEPAQP
jgi:hypothetical protein